MRMWMVPVETMCRKHLLGEHVESHMCLAIMRQRISMQGYVDNNLFEPESLHDRHEALAMEMLLRGYNHKSPMDWHDVMEELYHLPAAVRRAKVDKDAALADLHNRCPDCRARYEEHTP